MTWKALDNMSEDVAEVTGEAFEDALEDVMSRANVRPEAWQAARLRVQETVHREVRRLFTGE